ncbi:MAG: hypothetical protein AB1791_06805 [Chloroflexota bacterium]
MKHVAINTGSLGKQTPLALERAAGLGFRTVEVNLQTEEFGYGYQRKPNVRFYRELRRQVDSLGLSVWSVSAPPLTQAQMFYERARKDILMQAAGAAGILGAQVFVTYPADLFTTEIQFETYLREDRAPATIEGFDEAWAQVVNRRMTMALVNWQHWLGAPLTNQAERMAKITDDLAIGCALDMRRAVTRGALADWLEKISERLAVAYLYDLAAGEGEVSPAYRAPLDSQWQEWLPLLAGTRLKCLVMRADPEQSDEEITRSRVYVEDLVSK